MMRKIALSIAVPVLLVALAVVLALITPARHTAPDAVELPTTSRALCPIGGRMIVGEGDALAAQPLGGESAAVSGAEATTAGPVVLRDDAPINAGVLVEQPHRSYAPCRQAVTSGVVLVPDPGSTELVLVNGDSNEASVDLTLLGPDGEISAVGARGIALAPGASRRIALSVLAPTGPVGVAFRASAGRVGVIAAAVEGRPIRFAAASPVDEEHLLAGIPAGATTTHLLLTNPFEDRLDVSVQALGASSAYEPATAAGISVPARSSLLVDVGTALAGEASSLRVRADQPIAAAVVASIGAGSPATIVDADAGTHLSAAALLVAAGLEPREKPVRATVTTADGSVGETITIAAGTTSTLPLTAALSQVQVVADAPVIAAVASPAEAGTVVVPLGTSGGASTVTVPAILDPTLR